MINRKQNHQKILRAVLFDLDGTLIDTENQYTLFWSEIGRKYKPTVANFAETIKGRTLNHIFEEFFQDIGIRQIVKSRLDDFENTMIYDVLPSASDFIADLQSHGVKCAIVTSSNKSKLAAVRKQLPDFISRFDVVLGAEDYTESKPAPDCFIKACEHLNADFDECIVFEDALTGLQAAYRSSILAVGIVGTHNYNELKPSCDEVINSYVNKNFDWAQDILSKRTYISKSEQKVLQYLDNIGIKYTVYHHPEGKTIDQAKRWWHADGSAHCKNIFLRNHLGDQHYLICLSNEHDLAIHNLENKLKQELVAKGYKSPGKLSFASSPRLNKYLQVSPGSVSPFGLINDVENHVILLIDENLQNCPSLSLHPNDCRSTIVITIDEFEHFLKHVGNTFKYMKVYE